MPHGAALRALLSELAASQPESPWLTHCTRASSGARPGESQAEFLEGLILDSDDRSARATLERIVSQGELRASARGIRGAYPVVSFSARPLLEQLDGRVFRSHRGRWDGEPFGLCVRRARLIELGARPVCYGDDSDWDTLPEADRPWFQKRWSRDLTPSIDWSLEAEWRLPASLCLRSLSPADLFVFCQSRSDAKSLRDISHWPVISIEELREHS